MGSGPCRRARATAAAAGFRLVLQRATRTPSGGVSGGVGIVVHKGLKVGPLPHKGPHEDRWAPYLVAGTMGEWIFVSIYGYPHQASCVPITLLCIKK